MKQFGMSKEEEEHRAIRNEEIDEFAETYDAEMDKDLLPNALDHDDPPPETPEDALTEVRPVLGRIDPTPDARKSVTRIEIPWRTIVRVLMTLLMLWVFFRINGILMQLLVAFFLATAMLPLVRRLEQRGLSKGVATLIVFVVFLGILAGIVWIVVPPLVNQVNNVIANRDVYEHQLRQALRNHPSIVKQYDNLISELQSGGTGVGADDAVRAGTSVVQQIMNTIFVLTMTFYLLVEGSRAWQFIARYFTPNLRFRLRRSYPELSRVMSGYVVGQMITSLAFGVFCFIVLKIMDVPEALLLSVIAAILDAVPIVGAFAATVPAVIFAATVSPQAAIVVAIAYLVYQQFENYVVAPRVFGNTLQVSALSILVGVLIGGQLLGPAGVMLALPIAATIPALERIWNEPLPDEVQEAEEEVMREEL